MNHDILLLTSNNDDCVKITIDYIMKCITFTSKQIMCSSHLTTMLPKQLVRVSLTYVECAFCGQSSLLLVEFLSKVYKSGTLSICKSRLFLYATKDMFNIVLSDRKKELFFAMLLTKESTCTRVL